MFSFFFISRLLALLKPHYDDFQHSLIHGQFKLLCQCRVPASPRSSISALEVALPFGSAQVFGFTSGNRLWAAAAVLAPLLVLLHGVFEVRFHQGFTASSFVYWD